MLAKPLLCTGFSATSSHSGAIVQVKPKRLAFFKVGKELRERMNGGRRSTKVAAANEPTKLV